MFGRNYGVNVESRERLGTVVQIRIPVIRDENSDFNESTMYES